MAKRIVYPTSWGFSVLTNGRYAVTPDAAWRPASEIDNAKVFASERDAKTYICRWFPEIPMANFVIEDTGA